MLAAPAGGQTQSAASSRSRADVRATTRTMVTAVRDLGPQFTTNTASVLGHDVAYSLALAERAPRSLWVFGDTRTGTRSPETGAGTVTGMPANSMALTDDADARDGIQSFTYAVEREGTASPRLRLLSQEEGERLKDGTPAIRLWPMHGIALPSALSGSRVVLFYTIEKVIDGLPPPSNFVHLGTGIATAEIRPRDTAPPVFQRMLRKGSPILWGPEDPVVGTSVLQGRDGQIYVYASGREKDMPVAYVARVGEASLTDPVAYRWFAGQNRGGPPRYVGNLKEAHSLFAGMPVEMSVSWNSHLQKYLAIHTMLLGPDIALRTASAPEGPWSEPEIFHRPAASAPDSFFYAAKEHPHLARDYSQTLYVTYIDSAEYWPHLLELTLR